MSWISQPQDSSLLLQIIEQMDPAKADALVLMNDLTNSHTRLNASFIESQSMRLDDIREKTYLIDLQAMHLLPVIQQKSSELNEELI